MSKARQLADLGNQVDDGAITGSNMVVNGAMTVAQRGNVTGITTDSFGGPDRWQVFTNIGTLSLNQSADAPDGFSNSLEIDVTTAGSVASSTYFQATLKVEAQDVQHLNYGSSAAKDVTLSFWVKSNKSGTYQVNFRLNDSNKMASKAYTINAADTWEYKTLTVAGNTADTIPNDNGNGFMLDFWLASGSSFNSGITSDSYITRAGGNYNAASTVDHGTSTSDYWQITGVCLNVGDSAIDFPHDESYGETLARCQRYYQRWNRSAGGSSYLSLAYFRTTTDWRLSLPLPTPLRTQETSDLTLAVNDISDFKLLVRGTSVTSTSINLSYGTADILSINGTVSSGLTQGEVGQLRLEQSDTFLEIDAEL